MHKDVSGIVMLVLVVIIFVVAIFSEPIRGSFVSDEKALKDARAEFGQSVELGPKSVWFVSWQGCEKSDVAVYKVEPFEKEGVTIDNAILCASWPFKGNTPRYK